MLAIVAGVLYLVPSSDYIVLPDPPLNVDPLVKVPNEAEEPQEDGGIYMVDVVVRKATLLERLFPSLHSGSTLVPASRLNPEGVSESERRQQSQNQMSQSQKVAAAVALRYLGHHVEATPNGAAVSLVDPDAPASGELEIGDVIVEANGKRVRTPTDLRNAMRTTRPGQDATLGVRSSGATRELRVGTRADPDEPGRAVIGILVEQSANIVLPVPVRIDAGEIGGPSAGLAFALDIVDELGQDLDRDRRIVVTGEIDLDGQVVPIGGIKQKTIAAREADADVFLVPDENAAEARRYADGLDVVAVSTFRDALSVLTKR